jgi:parallel beta-helix repeat protein
MVEAVLHASSALGDRTPSPIHPVRTVDCLSDLHAALADEAVLCVRLASSGSPYNLGGVLHIARSSFTLEGEMLTADAISGNQSPPVILLGALLLSAGEVRSITIRPSRGAAPSTAIVNMPSSSTAVMRDCDVTAAPQAVSPTVGSTRLSSRASSACAGSLLRAPSRAGAAGSGGSGGSVAISVGRGSTARIERCRLRNGGISIAEEAAPLLVGNTIIGGSIVLCGTAVGCTLSENIICDSRGSGVLLSYRAAGTLTANVILRSAGVGLEVTSSSTPTVHRNQVLDSGGVGMLVRGGACGEFVDNVVRGAWSSAAELSGRGTEPRLQGNRFLEGSGRAVGVLIRDGAAPQLSGGEVSGHALAGIEVGDGANPTVSGCSIRRCGQAGVLLMPGASGTLRGNKIEANLRSGIECSSGTSGLLIEANTVSGHKAGVGILVRAGGCGHWVENLVSGNAVGIEVDGAGAHPLMQRNKVHGNHKAGVRVMPGASVEFADGSIRSNGHSCVVHKSGVGGRRGAPRPLIGDDRGAGVVVNVGGEARLDGNAISANAGAGVFADAHARLELRGNAFGSNLGDAVRARPSTSTIVSEGDAKSADQRRVITPAITRRQRVPFDWTIERGAAGNNVSADDKTLDDRVAEMRAQYYAMSGDKQECAAGMFPDGIGDPSTVCVIS